jgi:hypothetical protein
MIMDAQQAGIGEIKYYDKGKKQGVIAPFDKATRSGKPTAEDAAKQSASTDLYFRITDDRLAANLRVGQLVQFMKEETDIGTEAKQITVLSEK